MTTDPARPSDPARLPIPWSTRVIPIGTPPEQLPVLLERVLGTPARLRDLIAGHSPEQLRSAPPGRWSPIAHLAHLLWVQQRMADRLEDFLALRPGLCPIDTAVQEPELLRHIDRDPGDVLEEFRLERVWTVQALKEAGVPVHRHVARHPCGDRPMRTVDMLLWLAEHDDHHLAIMRHLLVVR